MSEKTKHDKVIGTSLDGKLWLPRFEQTCCVYCKHFNGKEEGNCVAYPNGIPNKFAIRNACWHINWHVNIEEDQQGNFTFEPD